MIVSSSWTLVCFSVLLMQALSTFLSRPQIYEVDAAKVEAIKDPLSYFTTDTIKAGEFHLVEFKSSMCGSCKAFEPKVEKMSDELKVLQKKKKEFGESVFKVGKIDIDKPDGMKAAEQQDALEAGIPNFRMYYLDTNTNTVDYRSIIDGDDPKLDAVKSKELLVRIKKEMLDVKKKLASSGEEL